MIFFYTIGEKETYFKEIFQSSCRIFFALCTNKSFSNASRAHVYKKNFACRKGKFGPIFFPKQGIENSIMGWFQEICCAFYAW